MNHYEKGKRKSLGKAQSKQVETSLNGRLGMKRKETRGKSCLFKVDESAKRRSA
jgi:hypothetical protein